MYALILAGLKSPLNFSGPLTNEFVPVAIDFTRIFFVASFVQFTLVHDVKDLLPLFTVKQPKLILKEHVQQAL